MDEEGSPSRCWNEIIPDDVLALIFRKLSIRDMLTLVPTVCKSWKRTIYGPHCWQEIDIVGWCQGWRRKPDDIWWMLYLLIPRSSRSLRRLSVSRLHDSALRYIADHAGSLQIFELPQSKISDGVVEQVTAKFSNLTFLDVSNCMNMGARALEAFGKHCRSLTGLRRMLSPLGLLGKGKASCDDEAHAIACSMPKLKSLEIAYLLVTNEGVLEILMACRNLELLDIRGCWHVEHLPVERFPGVKIMGPSLVDRDTIHRFETDDQDDSSDCSNSCGLCYWVSDSDPDPWYYDDWEYSVGGYSDDDTAPWHHDDDHVSAGLDVGVYDGGFNNAAAGADWPLDS